MEASTAEVAACTKKRRHSPLCDAYQALDILEDNFAPYTLGKAQDLFGLDLRNDEERLAMVSWPVEKLYAHKADHALLCEPRGLSLRAMMARYPRLFLCADDVPNEMLDWAPSETRYRLIGLQPLRHDVKVEVDEAPATAYSALCLMVFGPLPGRRPVKHRMLAFKSRGSCPAATIYYADHAAIVVHPMAPHIKLCLYERIPQLAT